MHFHVNSFINEKKLLLKIIKSITDPAPVYALDPGLNFELGARLAFRLLWSGQRGKEQSINFAFPRQLRLRDFIGIS